MAFYLQEGVFIVEFNISGILINNFGQALSRDEFFEFLFREYIEDVKANGFLANESYNYNSCLPFRSLADISQIEHHASHFSISLYYKKSSRLKENIRYIVSIPLDIDWGKKGIKATKSEVWHWVKEKTGLEISCIWNSKTDWCYHGVIRIEMMVGTAKSIHLHEWVTKEISKRINTDLGAANSNQWLRMKGYEKFSDRIYNIDELKCFLPSKEELEARQNNYNNDVVSLEKARITSHPAIKALLAGEIVSWRNNACFTAALLLKVLGYSQSEAEEHLSGDWFARVNNDDFDAPFKLKEVKDSVKSAFSGKYMGPSKEWIHNVTGIEFPWNINYVRTKYKKAHEVYNAILQFINKHEGIALKTHEIAEKTNLTEDIVRKALPKMKKEKLLVYETKRGKYNPGTQYYLGEEAKFLGKDKVLIEVDFGYRELEGKTL